MKGLTSEKCEFCREFLIDGKKFNGSGFDDLNNHICSKCWGIINKKFVILKMKTHTIRGEDERDEVPSGNK